MTGPLIFPPMDVALQNASQAGLENRPLGINGWLSPDGTFYACGFREHDRFATQLTVRLYASPEGTRRLETEHWMRVSNGSFRWLTRNRPTWAQYETACDLLNQELFPEIAERIRFSIRLMEMALRQHP